MAKFILTFGVQYLREPHPLGGAADPNGWIEVHSDYGETHARRQIKDLIGDKWSMLYTAEEFFSEGHTFEEMRSADYFPHGCTGTIRDGELVPAEQGEGS